ncbi:MAG: DUF459 domain-containing protein [Pseudomonadota bacterium]
MLALTVVWAPGFAGEIGDEGRIRMVVIGDSLADGVWAGLSRNLRRHKRFKIRREARVSSGLAAFDWHREAEQLIDGETDVVVIMLGANDGQAIRRRGETRIGYRASGWREGYADKVDELLELFEEREIYTVWLGLPTMRTDQMRRQAAMLNSIFSEVLENRPGVKYLSTWELTADKNGDYMAYADLDDSGRQRQFRAQDGVHFTMMGYQYLARHVQDILEDEYLTRRRAAAATVSHQSADDAAGAVE